MFENCPVKPDGGGGGGGGQGPCQFSGREGGTGIGFVVIDVGRKDDVVVLVGGVGTEAAGVTLSN